MEISIHDNFILSYSVDAQKKEIRLQTAYLDDDNNERTEVIFHGVAAYNFECDNFSNIICDIDDAELSYIYDTNIALFERLKNHGWPCFANSRTEVLKQMQQADIRGFVLSASNGLRGWVWAKAMEKVAA